MPGKINIERLPNGYYWLTWETETHDYTKLVHPWNLDREVAGIEAKYFPE